MKSAATARLEDLLSRPEGSWTLSEGALAIALLGHESADAAPTLERIAALGAAARERAGDAGHPRFVAGAISHALFDLAGLHCEHGNITVSHCMLDAGLSEGTVAPELATLIFLEVSRQAGRRFQPVGLPGRLLVRRDDSGRAHLFDAARRGAPVGIEECRKIVSDATGGKRAFSEGFLRPITAAQVLARLVARLKEVLWQANEFSDALGAVDLMLVIRPEDPREIRDRGRLLFLLGRLGEAIRAFESYLAHNPRGEDADVVRMLIQEARAGLPPSGRR